MMINKLLLLLATLNLGGAILNWNFHSICGWAWALLVSACLYSYERTYVRDEQL
jgi:hypothetical protein